MEHIEYMRVLGVNRIVVCDDRSTDNTRALQVRPRRPRRPSPLTPASSHGHGCSFDLAEPRSNSFSGLQCHGALSCCIKAAF